MIALLAVAFAEPPVAPVPVVPAPPPSRQDAAIARCLSVWGDHPFGASPTYRVLSTTVRVMGMGSRENVEDRVTDAPELVLVEPSVNVMTKTTTVLKNPNGWYCFAENVGVMSKLVFDAHCTANIADSRSGAIVMGRSSTNGGVIVMGNAEVRRDCPSP